MPTTTLDYAERWEFNKDTASSYMDCWSAEAADSRVNISSTQYSVAGQLRITGRVLIRRVDIRYNLTSLLPPCIVTSATLVSKGGWATHQFYAEVFDGSSFVGNLFDYGKARLLIDPLGSFLFPAGGWQPDYVWTIPFNAAGLLFLENHAGEANVKFCLRSQPDRLCQDPDLNHYYETYQQGSTSAQKTILTIDWLIAPPPPPPLPKNTPAARVLPNARLLPPTRTLTSVRELLDP